jgi:hypothetical protein
MTTIQTILLAGITTMAMSTFGSIAIVLVNHYAPRIAEHIEKKFRKPIDK